MFCIIILKKKEKTTNTNRNKLVENCFPFLYGFNIDFTNG